MLKLQKALHSFSSATMFLVIASVFFVAGVTARVAFAGWENPPDDPMAPDGGTAPLNIADITQEKKGGLYIASNEEGQLFVGVQAPDSDTDSRLKVNGVDKNYGISVLGATQRGLFIDGLSTSNFGIYVKDTQGWGTYSASVPTSTAGGVYGVGGTYGVFGEGADGALIGDTYAVYGKGARAIDGTSRYGVYGIAGEIGPTVNSPAKTYGVYAATFAGNTNKDTYALYVNDQSTGGPGNAYAAYIKGRSRITDGSRFGGVLENTLDIYTNTGKSGLYVEQGNVSTASTAISASGGESAIYALGMSADFNKTTYGVRVEAGNALNNSKSYGVYAKAGPSTLSNSSSYALYGETGESLAGGDVYGLYVVNNATDGERRTAFFEDVNNINESSVEISSKSGAYGLKVVGGKEAVIYAEPRIQAGALNTSFKAVYGKSHGSIAGEAQYGIYGEGAEVSTFGSTYGVYGLAGKTVTEGRSTYGVYGDSGEGAYGVYAKSPGAGTALAAENENHGFGYAAKFSGLVDLGSDGVFADGATFLNSYVFTSISDGGLSVGTMQPIGPVGSLTVNAEGNFGGKISARELWLTDQDGAGETRYKLTVRDNGSPSDDPQLCIDIPTDLCTQNKLTCVSNGYASFRTLDATQCETQCKNLLPPVVTCRWNCSGKVGYDDCSLFGTSTSGLEQCSTYVDYRFEGDSQAPAPNCYCHFENTGKGIGNIKEYYQAKYTGGIQTSCVDFGTGAKP